jgi:rod shape-determining protein MreD
MQLSCLRFAVPCVLITLATLLFAVITPLPALRSVAPDIAFITLFYWLSYAQALTPFAFVALIGLVHDSLYGLPLGLSSLWYLFLWLLLYRGRRWLVKEELMPASLVFALLSLVWFLGQWLTVFAVTGQQEDVSVMLLRWLLTSFLYVPSHLLLSHIYYRMGRG